MPAVNRCRRHGGSLSIAQGRQGLRPHQAVGIGNTPTVFILSSPPGQGRGGRGSHYSRIAVAKEQQALRETFADYPQCTPLWGGVRSPPRAEEKAIFNSVAVIAPRSDAFGGRSVPP